MWDNQKSSILWFSRKKWFQDWLCFSIQLLSARKTKIFKIRKQSQQKIHYLLSWAKRIILKTLFVWPYRNLYIWIFCSQKNKLSLWGSEKPQSLVSFSTSFNEHIHLKLSQNSHVVVNQSPKTKIPRNSPRNDPRY